MFRLTFIFTIVYLNTLCFGNSVMNSNQKISLNQGWSFSSEIYDQSFPATIPGSVHTDLFENNLIPDPFKGKVEPDLQWISTLNWIYEKDFTKPGNLSPNHQIEIVFNGLDTYADVYLNDSLIISANNMFVSWKANISISQLKQNNKLKVILKSTIKEEKKIYSQLPYELPEGSRACTRKAAYHYGWDWGPRYITAGIWQDIELNIWETAKIENTSYKIEKLDSSIAVINAIVKINSTENFKGEIKYSSANQSLKYLFNDVDIKKGLHYYHFKIEFDNPKLWWTHNLGKPYLYNFKIDLKQDNQILDTKDINIGLRKIELVQEKDAMGKSFYFKLNGIPVFMKGANYIPQSSFPGYVKDEHYKKIICDVKSANMNMLRVWGGGIYEKDIFYDLCDPEGILIWQDLMFANNMFPGDSLFIENVKKEALYQVERLSKHPSIALWCGNNEIDEAWHNWGWSTNYTKVDSAEMWNNYLRIFHEILPGIVKKISPDISYTSSSPMFGRGNPKSSFEGDNHYWYVWHDAYDFDWYNKVTGRFMSEFGFQSFPILETIEYFDSSKSKNISSEIILAHQKHFRGNYLINHYMKNYYPVPDDFNDFVYISQLLQAEGIRTGILAQRRAKPFCMGSLYWQLNDCWPAVSWSGIDYTGNWKALHYFVKQDFQNIIINPYLHNDTLDVFVVSDSLIDILANIDISLIDFKGEIKFKESFELTVLKNSSQLVLSNSVINILNQNSPQNHFLHIEFKSNKQILDSRNILFEKAKDLQLEKMSFDSRFKKIQDGYEIILNSNVFIKSLYLQNATNGHLSENFIDLIPGIEKRVIFKTDKDDNNPARYFKYMSLNEIINKY